MYVSTSGEYRRSICIWACSWATTLSTTCVAVIGCCAEDTIGIAPIARIVGKIIWIRIRSPANVGHLEIARSQSISLRCPCHLAERSVFGQPSLLTGPGCKMFTMYLLVRSGGAGKFEQSSPRFRNSETVFIGVEKFRSCSVSTSYADRELMDSDSLCLDLSRKP